MMYVYKYTKHLLEVLKKLKKKNRKTFDVVIKKIKEIREDPEIGKPLSYGLKTFRRVHVEKSFVLVYQLKNDVVAFVDFDHHGNIYRRGTYIFSDEDLVTNPGE